MTQKILMEIVALYNSTIPHEFLYEPIYKNNYLNYNTF